MPDPDLAGASRRSIFTIDNLKGNWYVPLLSFTFFALSIHYTASEFISSAIAIATFIVIAACVKPLRPIIRSQSRFWKCFCLFSALGVLAGSYNHIYEFFWSFILRGDVIGISLILLFLLITVGAVLFLYICISFFWIKLKDIFIENKTFSGVGKAEWIIYSVLILLCIIYVTVAFYSSRAFYGSERLIDVVYMGDSQRLFHGNVYLNIWNPDNDLRQPLFAVFAAPFVSVTYLIGALFKLPHSYQAILLDYTQVLLLFISVFLIARIMNLDTAKRIAFMFLFNSTYTFILFSMMLEQYVIAFFWLVLCFYGMAVKRKIDKIALFGAGGTLVTSLAVIPFVGNSSDINRMIYKILSSIAGFFLLIIVFGKMTIFIDMWRDIPVLLSFTGNNVGLYNRICQFTWYVRNFFVAPEAKACTIVDFEGKEHISWQQDPVESINYIGIIILIFALISLVINRDKISSRIAGGWIMLSMIVLIVVGWGTRENGLILYELYFGWPYLVLIYQLIEKISDKFNLKKIFPVICVGATVLLAVVNIPGIIDLIDYMSSYYPA